MISFNRRHVIRSFATAAAAAYLPLAALARHDLSFDGRVRSYHGFALHHLLIDGCAGHLVRPHRPLPGHPWIWRTMFWDSFQDADIAFLAAGFHVAYIEVGNTFGSPEALKHFDAFYAEMIARYGLSPKPALEGLSRGGLYAYRWACSNASKVGAIYGDAPVCDMKSWPGGKGKGDGSPADWSAAISAYHFADETEMLSFQGNPIDALAPLAAADVPVIHVCGDADTVVPPSENTDIVRARYIKMGGRFASIVKRGCAHHPHGLKDMTPVVDFVTASCAHGPVAERARQRAPKPESILILEPAQWDYVPVTSAPGLNL